MCTWNFTRILSFLQTLTNEIQHYERRKHGIINSILSTLGDKFQSPLPPSELRNFSVASDLIPKELDQKSGSLLRILGEIQQEWDETIRKITPISPFTNQISFLEGEYWLLIFRLFICTVLRNFIVWSFYKWMIFTNI